MKAISLYQPWASLIFQVDPATGLPKKRAETRSWAPTYRGDLAIHATKFVDRAKCLEFGLNFRLVPRGAVLGTVTLVDCVQFPDPRCPPDPYGDYTEGRWGWILADPAKFPRPIPATGRQTLWEWAPPPEVQ